MFLEWENNSRKLQIISVKFQNSAINDVKQISLSHLFRARMSAVMKMMIATMKYKLAINFLPIFLFFIIWFFALKNSCYVKLRLSLEKATYSLVHVSVFCVDSHGKFSLRSYFT